MDSDKKEISREDIVERSPWMRSLGAWSPPRVEIEDKYTSTDYDAKLMLDDRVKAMSEDLSQFLLDTGGPHQKTVISLHPRPSRQSDHDCVEQPLHHLVSEGAAHAEGMVRLPMHRQPGPAFRPPAS